MARIPKVVGVRQNTKDGLWKEFGERLRGNLLAPGVHPERGRRANRGWASAMRLKRAFADEDR